MQATAALRIMIVEDEGIIAEDIAARLNKAGHAVTSIAASSEEVFDNLRESPPDLILMDIHIEGSLDGIETAAKVREMSGIPIVYLSAYADRETMSRTGATGAFAFVTKPISSAKLLVAIEGTMRKQHSARN
jgi:CheY-like chemotaxis protein